MMMKTQSIIPSQQKNPYITIKVGNLDKQFFFAKIQFGSQGGSTVVIDMALSMVSIVCNLMVITAIREKEPLLAKTFNLVLLNLCLSNLANSVMVKSGESREVKIINISVSQLTAHHVLKLTKQKLSN